MVGDFRVVGILCLCNIGIQFFRHDGIHELCRRRKAFQAADILIDFLGNRCGQYTGIGSRIGSQLFLVQILRHLQRLVRADLKALGTFRLKLRQIKQ